MTDTKTVGLLFSGGPAPAANAVISSTTLSFLDQGYGVVGFLEGFSKIQTDYAKTGGELKEGRDFLRLDESIASIRNQPGVFVRTARAHPGIAIKSRADLDDPEKTVPLRAVIASLSKLNIDVLITMGGDDTLKTANYLHLMGVKVIHIPKTIDNDYFGIPWTFGYWTAVETARKLLLNLKADADSTNAYYLVELMGRKAGWLAYAAGIAGEACDILAAEDIDGDLDPKAISGRFTELIIAREAAGRTSGIICISEGLAEKLPDSLKPRAIDQHGNVYYGHAKLCATLAENTAALYKEKTGRTKKVHPKQIGYETRCAEPISYDVVLGCILGHGAFVLHQRGLYGHMVSVKDNMEVFAVPFSDLVDSTTLLTKTRFVPNEGGLFALKEALRFPLPTSRRKNAG